MRVYICNQTIKMKQCTWSPFRTKIPRPKENIHHHSDTYGYLGEGEGGGGWEASSNLPRFTCKRSQLVSQSNTYQYCRSYYLIGEFYNFRNFNLNTSFDSSYSMNMYNQLIKFEDASDTSQILKMLKTPLKEALLHKLLTAPSQ